MEEDVGYRSISHVDGRQDCMYIHASADPTQQHVVRVPLGLKGIGGQVEVITSSPGMHKALIKRSSSPYAVHQFNSITQWPVYAVRRLDREGHLDGQSDGVVVADVAEPIPFQSRVSIEMVEVASSPLPLYTAVIPPSDLGHCRWCVPRARVGVWRASLPVCDVRLPQLPSLSLLRLTRLLRRRPRQQRHSLSQPGIRKSHQRTPGDRPSSGSSQQYTTAQRRVIAPWSQVGSQGASPTHLCSLSLCVMLAVRRRPGCMR